MWVVFQELNVSGVNNIFYLKAQCLIIEIFPFIALIEAA